MKVCFILLVAASIGSAMDLANFGDRYFEVLLDRFEVVEQDTSILKASLKVTNTKAKVRIMTGQIDVMIPFGNDITVEGKTLKKQGGEYRYLPYRLPATPICDGLVNEKFMYPDFAMTSDFPEDVANNCPFSPGTYKVYNTTCDLSNMPSIERIAQSGDYAAEFVYYYKGKHFATHRLYATINNVSKM